jgi:L-lactate dehydrogenase complex protein LldG
MSEATATNLQPDVLDEIRRALGRTVTAAPQPLPPFIEPRTTIETNELIDRFTAEATAVGAHIHLAANETRCVELIAEICSTAGSAELATSGSDFIARLNLVDRIGPHGLAVFSPAVAPISHEDLIARLALCGAGVTTVDYAIAETGTIVLSNIEKHALLVSLLPPLHLAILRSSQIAASLDEVIQNIGRQKICAPAEARSVTLITGPSRTSDVELVLSIGVHGPKELHVIILDG